MLFHQWVLAKFHMNKAFTNGRNATDRSKFLTLSVSFLSCCRFYPSENRLRKNRKARETVQRKSSVQSLQLPGHSSVAASIGCAISSKISSTCAKPSRSSQCSSASAITVIDSFNRYDPSCVLLQRYLIDPICSTFGGCREKRY